MKKLTFPLNKGGQGVVPIIAAIVLSCFAWQGFAQAGKFPSNFEPAEEPNEGYSWCGVDEHMAQHPEAMKSFEEMNKKILENPDAANKMSGVVKYIPTVVHVLHDNGVTKISLAQVQGAIQKLNDDFRGISGGVNAADTEIEFFLATRDPSGNCTDGVTWTLGSDPGAIVWPTSESATPAYMNIWTKDITGGVLGYATLGAVQSGGGSIVVKYDWFTSTEEVATQEVGHWFGLYHTFQNGCAGMTLGNCATAGDGLCDTPPMQQSSSCTQKNTCSESYFTPSPADRNDPIENFQSYNIGCQDRYTADGGGRMLAYLAGNTNLTSAANLTATGFNSTSSDDATTTVFDPAFKAGASSFNSTITSLIASSQDFNITLTANHPADWSASFTIDGNTYPSSATINFGATAAKNITIDVTPGTTPAVGDYTISVDKAGGPGGCGISQLTKVIGNVTDLIITNDGSFGNQQAYDWTSLYEDGLNYAGNSKWAVADPPTFIEAINANALSGAGVVNNIYFNMGWTFPSFTDENVAALSTFLDNGGNMFIAGQDIGWDTWVTTGDPKGNGTPATQSFYTNYLQTKYLNDGSTVSTSIVANTSDDVFGGLSNSAITNPYGLDDNSNPNQYPEEIQPDPANPNVANVSPIFSYNTAGGVTGGVKVWTGVYKIVYLGIGLEQIGDVNVKNEFVKLSHDWFYGLVGIEEFDNGMNALGLGQNYPNPSDEYTIIPLTPQNHQSKIEIIDVLGRVVINQTIEPGTKLINVNTSQLKEGIYLYRITGDDELIQTKSMGVMH